MGNQITLSPSHLLCQICKQEVKNISRSRSATLLKTIMIIYTSSNKQCSRQIIIIDWLRLVCIIQGLLRIMESNFKLLEV